MNFATPKYRALTTLACLWFAGAGTAAAAEPATISAGQVYFEKICAKCHETGIGPELTGRDLPEATFIVTARIGRNGMPAFRITDIDDQTLIELARYLASTARAGDAEGGADGRR
ncbi:hypothetical protein Thimo_2587 [Thioflavicoccus mobilis 8321]|uniref:Cytochrome c domain-containing protein n=1 Tax=Thioflavicoccus mobilis 8321 TaxID=765912 RepID=L0GZC1_9GAMM|nr:cytochrome c [Thioflavicoccus mobilis]AGA91311.1 hypothetical protein Thimo_2587 [Thioflavicoccus mobilis 8321]